MLISSSAEVKRMVTGCGKKLKAPVVKQKSFELEKKGKKNFKLTGKGDKWTILLSVGEENRVAILNFGEKTMSGSTFFETALPSLDSIYRKLRQTSQNPTKTIKYAKWMKDTRQGEHIFFILSQKSNILFQYFTFHTKPCRVFKF